MKIKLIQPRMTLRPMDSEFKRRMAPSLALLTISALTTREHEVYIEDENVNQIESVADEIGVESPTNNVRDEIVGQYVVAETFDTEPTEEIPILQTVKVADFGDSDYDDYINGFTGEVKIVGAEHTLKLIETAMAFADTIVDTAVPPAVVGLTDAKIGTSMRAKGQPMKIHPREMGVDPSLDINLYLVASVGAYTRSFGNEQGKNELTFKMYPREGADASKGSNFYYVGNTDPNQA
jgi:hypothetical protein